MKPSPQKKEKTVNQKPLENQREPYQTPDIIYEGTISIRAGSPIGFTDPGNPFGSSN